MNSNKLLIITVVFAVLILGTAITYALMIGKQDPADAPPAMQSQAMGEQVVVPDSLTRCHTGDTCVVVDTTCSFCCKYVAINAAHEQLFDEMFNDNCTGFKGSMCECFDLSSYPKCIDGVCSMVKFTDQPPR
jgi:hypothetical protein